MASYSSFCWFAIFNIVRNFTFMFFKGKIIFKTNIYILLLFETYLRFCFIILVKRYQAVAKEETRRRCKCVPSCSEYAILSLKKIFPLLLALLKIRKRLFKTCNGEEYKIDFPLKKMGEEFENKL
ncbi:MAG: membrane protein insertion efficiency factor YidD [Clostridia bacterium]|nr:membrane protein insertion efficiency factor YidD [Clostridia bacterium]